MQVKYYEKALAKGTKDQDGKPIVTKEQLEYAKEHGFGDTNNDKQITGSELRVADINDDKKIDFRDGDITGDRKVSRYDKGVDLRTPEATAGGDAGGGMKVSANAMMSFLDQLMTIWKLK